MRVMKLESDKKSFARYLRKTSTDSEQLLWFNLRGRRFLGVKFRRQQPVDKYIVDFISFEKKLIIELDGGQHSTEKGVLGDSLRTECLKKAGFNVLRFWNNEVLENTAGVLERIYQEIDPSPQPSPKKGEGV